MEGGRALLLGLVMATCFRGDSAQTTECVNATVADIVFLVDGSSSIGDDNFQEVRVFLRNFVSGLDVGPNRVRVGLAQYSDDPHQEFLLKDHLDKRSLLNAVGNFPYRGGNTYTGKAIDFLLSRYFTPAAGSRGKQRVPQFAVVITDGESADNVSLAAQRLRQHGVIVFAIGVGQANLKELESIANRPPQRFLSTIDSYQALRLLTEGLLQTVCISMEDQRRALAERFADIFFLVDSGVTPADFQQIRNILVRLVNQMNVGANAYRFGLAQYGEEVSVNFLLNAFETKEKTITAVRSFRHQRLQSNEPRNLGAALQYAATNVFITEAGSRADQGYRQYLVVLSGKDSDDSVHKQARLVKSEGVSVLGMSLGASMTEIRSISTAPYSFPSIANAVPTLKGIFEQQEVLMNLTGDCQAAKLADIVFIVDESGSITTPNFQLIRGFLHSIVSGLEVGLNRVRVGIVQYSDRAVAQVYLNTFDNKADLLKFIKILPYRGGGTNTGAALNFTRTNVFTEARGCRKKKNVQQVAVVITDGESQDEVGQAAAELRRDGITVYSVGIKLQNRAQLVEMASHPPNKHVFVVDSFTKLKPLEQSLQKILCNNIIHQAISVNTRRTGIKEGCVQTDEADIFFLIDHSGSIHPTDFQDMKKFIMEFISTFRISPQHVRLGVAKYADDPNLEIDLTMYSDARSLEKAVEKIKQVGGGTETGKALQFMGPLFDRAEATRGHKVTEYLVVITDGKSSDDVKVPAQKLRSQGIIVYSVGVKNADQEELKEISGDKKRTFFVNNFDALKPIKDDIITDICSTDACEDIPGDLLFLIDSSGSIYPQDYEKMKDFMKAVVEKSNVGPSQVHIGVMQYSSIRQLVFPLNRFNAKDELLRSIDGMQQIGGGTDTGRALTDISQYFDPGQGGRPGLRQRLVVITDGESQDEVKGPAASLRAKGVVIYAIGVMEANSTQLLEISGSPDRRYIGRDFDALKDLESQVALELCDPERDCKKTEKADIIFLVDGSSSITLAKFDRMQKFMSSIVSQTTVGQNLTRFGVILYSDDPELSFTLKQHVSKNELKRAIAALKRPSGMTYTGKALDYSLGFFGPEHGGRAALQVPQILMVITDGEATDPTNLEAPSLALQQNGVSVFSIGVQGADRTQLDIMAGHDASKVFYVDNFDALETLQNSIMQVICDYTKPVCEKQTADLVFLLDQSGSIDSRDYTLMKKFTSDLVNSFTVSTDLVRVGLAQFSRDFHNEFYLNKHRTAAAVAEDILKLKQLGGGTNIGRALMAIAGHFDVANGARRRISRNLVLITDGESQDDVQDAADNLRNLGIEVFAIGVGNVHDLELLQITRSPERLFTVQDFGSLERIKQKVVDTICKSKPQKETSACTIDIAMGFDVLQRPGGYGETLINSHPKLRIFLPEIARYVSSIKGLCCEGPDPIDARIGYRVVGPDGREIYDASFEALDDDAVRKVMTLELAQPTLFNSALLKSFGEKFATQSTAQVKVVLIFSDGLDEDVMKLQHEAELLRKSGISALLVVALEGVRDSAKLQLVEFGRGFGYKLPLSIGMSSVGSSILQQIDAVASRECCNLLCKCSGHEGIRGSWGLPGSKGVPGLKGHRGFPGEEGVSGDRGYKGSIGPQGVEGCSGLRGIAGGRGFRGDKGEDGEEGLDGVNGEQGSAGGNGSHGERGFPGQPGIPGISGEPGVKGQRGLRGDPGETGADNNQLGPKGEDGNPGLPGRPGPDGRPGEAGVRGFPGSNGRRGQFGVKGGPGDPGAVGLPGLQGASGPQGPRGVRGPRGPPGGAGLPGQQGAPGLAGPPGEAGRRGGNGQKGQPGDPGIRGAIGPPGPRGVPGQDGRDGNGVPGPKGAKGDPGFPGYPGLPGEDGLKGPGGYPGRKGNRGRGGNSGLPGESGGKGEIGHLGYEGPRGPPGAMGMTECQLVIYIRENCACCRDRFGCPAYPTELVFGLDMSDDVTPAAFERQRAALLALLDNVDVAESDCPNGARVAVVGYSAHTKYLIRFTDYRRRRQLLEAVQNLALERTSNKRWLGAAMRFVGQHLFKRVRASVRTRKVAVFFTGGNPEDADDIVTAVMEYRGLNIIPAVVSLRSVPRVVSALELDDSGNSMFTLLGRQQDLVSELSKIKNCAVCYDPCSRSEECAFIQEPLRPQEVNVDLVLVPDGSREVRADEYAGAQQLLSSVVEQLAVTPDPDRASGGARVSAVQQSGSWGAKVEFQLQTYRNQQAIQRHLLRMRQAGGSQAMAATMERVLSDVLLKATQSRRKKAALVVVGSKAATEQERKKLRYVSDKAKCAGVALFVVTVGYGYDRAQVEKLASAPVEQHLLHLSTLQGNEQGYARRFFRNFLSALNKGVYSYPPPSERLTCARQEFPDEGQIFLTGQGSEDLDEFVAADEEQERFLEQSRDQTQTSQLDVVHTVSQGDGQRFVTEELDDPALFNTQIDTSGEKDACFLPQDQGGCENYVMMWFFDTEQNECARFWYSGCDGNGNRFNTQQECEDLCLSKS